MMHPRAEVRAKEMVLSISFALDLLIEAHIKSDNTSYAAAAALESQAFIVLLEASGKDISSFTTEQQEVIESQYLMLYGHSRASFMHPKADDTTES